MSHSETVKHSLVALEETKEMMKASGEVTLTADQKYGVVLHLIKELREKKNEASAKLSPTLTVTSPEGTVVFFTGNVDYKQNKHLKAGLELEIKDVLRKPIATDCKQMVVVNNELSKKMSN